MWKCDDVINAGTNISICDHSFLLNSYNLNVLHLNCSDIEESVSFINKIPLLISGGIFKLF